MAEKRKLSERWSEYRPSKALWFWSCAVCVGATIFIGFDWSGWVTGGTAENMMQQARNQLVANECAARFEGAPDANAELATLKKTDIWKQDDFIVSGGWVTPSGAKKPVSDAADLCLHQLLTAKLPLGGTAASPVTKPAGSTG